MKKTSLCPESSHLFPILSGSADNFDLVQRFVLQLNGRQSLLGGIRCAGRDQGTHPPSIPRGSAPSLLQWPARRSCRYRHGRHFEGRLPSGRHAPREGPGPARPGHERFARGGTRFKRPPDERARGVQCIQGERRSRRFLQSVLKSCRGPGPTIQGSSPRCPWPLSNPAFSSRAPNLTVSLSSH